MTIYQGSRYERSTVVRISSDRGWRPAVLRDLPAAPNQYLEVIAREGETIEQLAARSLGDPEQWWRIADANPELIYPDHIPPGTIIRIPYVDRLR
jgi:nucleoid-associated protein YgaU